MNNKIPPPIVTLICGLAIYFSKTFFNKFFSYNNNTISLFLLILGFTVFTLAVKAFNRQKTTVNPLEPRQASSLVSSGIFKYSRNPMYLGMLIILLALSFKFNLLGGIVISLFFYLFITKFQILPEEEAMNELFGDEFTEYSNRTRRWI
ncbi:isoprenylcysteine carboxylmethyltransferase family protein [Candidatus Marinimicrobia bacterium]|nr:isoprenylcysteine carboxylmethyltransferase family protein [Candidatus Neomarinimicrobiota bacterium]MDA9735377.1 isoprenylcysteine carboxylmethyltransferase family protein [Candidatus Neomarinimicrobiota bacterium]